MRASTKTPSSRLRCSAGATLLIGVSLLALGAPAALADGPRGGTVARGSAKVTASTGHTTITQTSQRAVIDWQGFDVGKDHTVTFDQPGKSSATLNRVRSASASVIQGAIKAPGTVVIQNGAGVLFTGTAKVDTGGLVATSQTVNAARFQKNGGLSIGGGETAGARVVNEGSITVGDKGLAALVGTSVENAGIIIAKQGTVALASGKRTAIDLSGDGSFQIAVEGDSAGGGATHSGSITAGQVLITAGDAASALDGVINTAGVIRATTAKGKGGRIVLEGRGKGKVTVAGTATAGTGGSVAVTGETISVAATARLGARKGSVKVGGDFHGKGPMPRAKTVTVAAGAELSAAKGEVVVWSDGTTRMDGTIAAAGGKVETSGVLGLDVGDTAAVTAASWLLDPRNVTIGASGAGAAPGTNNPPAGSGEHVVSASAIRTALQTGDVTITTDAPGSADGDITLATPLTWTGPGSLTLDADGDISLGKPLTTTDGSFTAKAGGGISVNAAVTSKGKGNLSFDATGNLLVNADVRASGTGALRFTSAAGNIVATPGSAEDLRITTASGAMAFSAAKGAVIIRRSPHAVPGVDYSVPVATGGATIEVNSKSGDISMTAGTEILIKGEDKAGQWVRVGSNNSSSALTFKAPRIQVQGGLASDSFAEVVTGAGGSITMDAGKISAITKKSLGRIAALDGADLTLRAEWQRWWGEVRAGSGGHTGGNVLVSGLIDATVEPLFGLADNKSFTLAPLTPGGAASSYASALPLSVSTSGTGSIDIGGPVTAANISLLSEEHIGLGKGASLTATGTSDTGTPLVVSAGREFVNEAGADALKTSDPKSRWLLYIDTFAGLVGDEPQSHGFDLYGRSISDTPPQTVTHSGNRIIYAERPVLTITGETLEKTYGEKATPGLTLSGFRKGDSLETALVSGPSVGSDGTPATADAGSYATEVAATASDQGYLLKLVDGTLKVKQAALTVTADDKARTYGQANPAFTGKVSGFVLGQGLDDLDGTLAFTSSARQASDAGTYAINGGGVSSGNYAITYVPGALTVNKATLTAVVKDAAKTYGSDNPALTADYTGFVLGQDESVLGGALTTDAKKASDVGTYGITTDGLISKNYEIVGTPGTLTINKAALKIAVDDKTRTYGSGNPKLTATVTGFVLGQDESVLDGGLATGATKESDVGDYAITADGVTAKNYEITSIDGTLSIDPAELTVTVDDKSKVYGQDNPVLTATYAGFVLGQDESVLGGGLATGATKTSGVGTYAITADGVTSKNYTIKSTDGTLTVGKAMLTVTADDKTRSYGSANPALTGGVTGFVLGDDIGDLDGKLIFATPATQTSDAGAYVITGSGLSGGNYAFTWVPGTLTVKKAILTAAINDAAKTYGSDNPTLTADYSGFVLGQDKSVLGGSLSTDAKKGSDVGMYDITTGGLISKNYEIVGGPGTLTVNKAILTVAVDDKARTYGSDNPALTASYSGFVLGQDESVLGGGLSTGAKKASDVGTYGITAGGLTAKNYEIVGTDGTLTVKKATLTVAVDDKTRTYGADNPKLTASYSGFVLGQDESVLGGGLSTGAKKASDVGTYGITTKGLTAKNYDIVGSDGTLAVTPAALTIRANDATRTAGTANPPFSATATGFVLGQGLGDLGGDLGFETDAGIGSPAGGYGITPGGVTSGNYAITFLDGTLTVTPGTGGVVIPDVGSDGAAAWAADRFRRGMPPLTPGDASFRTTIAEAPPALANPFELTYSLGEIVQTAPVGGTGTTPGTDTGGFVPAAGRPGAGGGNGTAAADCAPGPINLGPVNLGTVEADCTRQAVTESYWTTIADGAR